MQGALEGSVLDLRDVEPSLRTPYATLVEECSGGSGGPAPGAGGCSADVEQRDPGGHKTHAAKAVAHAVEERARAKAHPCMPSVRVDLSKRSRILGWTALTVA
jgi:hypothetical protein